MAAKTFEEYWDDNHISEGYREMYKACWNAAIESVEGNLQTEKCTSQPEHLQQPKPEHLQQPKPEIIKLCSSCARIGCHSRFYYSKAECCRHIPA
jgi:hypothetical protein